VYALSVVKMPTEGRFFGWLSDALGLESTHGSRYAFYDAAGWTQGYATIGHVPTQTDVDNGWRIVDVVRAADGPVMSEEAAFNLHADKEVITNPTQLKNLYENGLYDSATLVAALHAHDFAAVIFRAQFYPPPVLDAVYEAYYPAEAIPMNGFSYEIWRPGPPAEQRAAFAASLVALLPGEARTMTLALPFDSALDWRGHAMTYRQWQAAGGKPQPAGEDGECIASDFSQDGRVISIEACPAGAETLLTLTRTR